MKKSVAVENNYPCSGCGACQVICPRGAIQYCLNDEGFYHAVVDEEKCIDCGLCQSVCIRFLSDKEVDDTVQINKAQVAGAYTTDSIVHRKTTSGGIAYELGRWGIESGYKLLGVVYDYEKDEAVSVLVDDLDGLTRLSGSKYLQSNSAQVLSVLIEDAQNNPDGKYICFGTPCQIFGLRKLITRKKLKNEFLLIDLFCHGVPSYLVWQEYISHQKALLGNLKNISFRYKGNGWHQYTIRIEGTNAIYQKLCYRDVFYRFFFDNVALNASCFRCPVRKSCVAADLRLGDFLGKNYEHREDGVSAVLIATERGRMIFDKLVQGKRVVFDRYWSLDTCLSAQSTEDYPNIDLRNAVISRLQKGERLSQIQKWYVSHFPIKRRMRIRLKQLVALLPNTIMISIRRMIRI